MSVRQQRSELAVNVGLVANLVLAALKTTVGVLGHSPALLADGVNSTSDVAYYVVVKIFTRSASAPPDREHPYGHRQLESIAALVVGAFVVVTGIAIFWDSVSKAYDLLSGASEWVGASAWALWVALATVALKLGLTRWSRRIGLEAENPAVLALAADHRNDVFAAAGAAVGIYLGQRGHPWVDPAAGALVALIVFLTGIEILRDAAAELTYAVPGEAVARRVIAVATAVPGVVEVEELHGHRFGPYLIINVVIGVDGSISVADGDAIASRVEEVLMEKIELIRRVYVHYHPAADRMQGEGSRSADRAPTD